MYGIVTVLSFAISWTLFIYWESYSESEYDFKIIAFAVFILCVTWQVRLMMKAHSFIRENVPKVWSLDKNKTSRSFLPPTSSTYKSSSYTSWFCRVLSAVFFVPQAPAQWFLRFLTISTSCLHPHSFTGISIHGRWLYSNWTLCRYLTWCGEYLTRCCLSCCTVTRPSDGDTWPQSYFRYQES